MLQAARRYTVTRGCQLTAIEAVTSLTDAATLLIGAYRLDMIIIENIEDIELWKLWKRVFYVLCLETRAAIRSQSPCQAIRVQGLIP